MEMNYLKKAKLLAVLFGVVTCARGSYAEGYPMPSYNGPATDVDLAAFASFEPILISAAPNPGTPIIAEWTRQSQPGDTMALTGEALSLFTANAEGRDTRFVLYGEGAGFTDGLIQRLDERQCALTLPSTLPPNDMYLLWPRNDNGFGKPVSINQTEVWWVGPDQVTRGDTFSVYGRNLVLGDGECHLYIDGYGWLTSISANPYKADFQVPPGLSNDTYDIYAHNGHGGRYGWASKHTLVVNNGFNWTGGTTINVKNAPYNAKGDGVTDDFNAINSAFNDAGPGDTVYFPAGTYLISDYFRDDFDDTRIIGDGMNLTIIKTHPTMSRDWMIYGSIKNASIEDLTLGAGTGGSSKMQLLRINGSQNTVFKNVRFSQAEYVTTQKGGLLYLGGAAQHVTFKDCRFDAAGAEGTSSCYIGDANTRQIFMEGCDVYGMHDLNTFIAATGDELSIVNCTLQNFDSSNPTNSYGWAKGRFIDGLGRGSDGQRNNPSKWYFGGNSINGVSPRNAAPIATAKLLSFNGPTATVDDASGFIVGKQMRIMDGRSEGNYSNIIAVDTVSNTVTISKVGWLDAWAPDPEIGDTIACRDFVDGNSGEMFMCEGSRARYRSNPVSATSNTVTFASISGIYEGLLAYIVSGKGQGQAREISDFTGTTITLEKPWNVVPDSGSVIMLCDGSHKFVAYGNHFEGTQDSLERNVASTGVEIYGAGFDWIVVGNRFESLRQGISEYSYIEQANGVYLVAPVFSFYYGNNIFTNCYQGIERALRFPSTATSFHEDPLLIGSVFRKNSIVGCLDSAIYCGLEKQYKNADVIELSIWDKNEIANCNQLIFGRDGFFNQVWVGNKFVSANNGVGLTHLNNTATLRGNVWHNFGEEYASSSPGAILAVPKRVYPLYRDSSGAQIEIYNSGTAPLSWTATSDSPWVTIAQDSNLVPDENSTGTLMATVDTTTAPLTEAEAIITVQSGDQQQQIAMEYSPTLEPPPPDGPPAPVLAGIAISGAANIDEQTSAQYVCTATYSDGTSAIVAANWSENSTYASISTDGLLSAGNIAADQSVMITASYGGMTDTHAVTIKYVAPTLTGITIAGPTSVNEETTAQYSCTATWSDGTTTAVAPTWSENSSYASINATGLLTAGNVASDQSVTVTASYGGKSDTHAVTIKYVAPTLTGITISGPTSVEEETTAQFSCTAHYSDGTSDTVSPNWSENSSFATISSGGFLNAGNVSSDESVTITASYNGKTDSHSVTILYVAPPVVVTGISISGPAELDENSTASFSCTASYSDGTTEQIHPVWSENAAFASISASGVLSVGNIEADSTLMVTASYQGFSDTHAMSVWAVKTRIVYPLSGFSGKLVRAQLWDDAAQTLIPLGEMDSPDELVIADVNANQWYWILVEEYDPATDEWIRVRANWINM